jgi:pimeloyl-ACP methyl ester carboxylesterase
MLGVEVTIMSKVISRDNTLIAYEKSGSGPSLVLVDGAMSYRSFGLSKPLASMLASNFSAYIYDRRGRGESTDHLPYAVEREIEDIEAIIDEAGGHVYLYGVSSGAVLALKAAAALGTRVRKLAVYEPPFSLGEAGSRAAAEYSANLKQLLEAGKRGDAVALFMQRVGNPTQMIDYMRNSPQWPSMEAVAPTLAYDDAVMGGGGLPPQASSLKIPTLVMAGGASPQFMRDAAQAFSKAIPKAEFRVLPGQTHAVEQAVMAPALTGFFLG